MFYLYLSILLTSIFFSYYATTLIQQTAKKKLQTKNFGIFFFTKFPFARFYHIKYMFLFSFDRYVILLPANLPRYFNIIISRMCIVNTSMPITQFKML